jgi:hypothetical protein
LLKKIIILNITQFFQHWNADTDWLGSVSFGLATVSSRPKLFRPTLFFLWWFALVKQ